MIKIGYIYKIYNDFDEKVYIGQTLKERPTDRFSQHKYIARHPEQGRGESYLHKSMTKHGVEHFSFEIIEEVDNELLNEKEIYWISYFNSQMPNGYNMTSGGEGTNNYSRPQSDEERQKKGESIKQFLIDHPEEIEARRTRLKEQWQDPEYAEKITAVLKEQAEINKERFKGEGNPFYGKKHTEESLAKMRQYTDTKKLKIVQLDKDTLEEIKFYDGVRDAEKALGVGHGWISKAARSDKVAYGYRWKFI